MTGFGNPILAQEQLIRSGIKSKGYRSNTDVLGPNGWRIGRDGAAEFASLDLNGTASGPLGAYDTVEAANSLLYQGDELSTLLAAKPAFVIAQGDFSPAGAIAIPSGAINEKAIIQLNSVAIDGLRGYKFCMGPVGITNTTAGCRVLFNFRYRLASGGDVINTDPSFQVDQLNFSNALPQVTQGQRYAPALATGVYNICMFAREITATAGGAAFAAGDNINIWIEDTGLRVPNIGRDRTAAGTSKIKKNLSVLSTLSRCYDGAGNLDTYALGDQRMYQGQFDAVLGNTRSWCVFPTASTGTGNGGTIADMAGVPLGSIDYIQVFLFYYYWYLTTGGIAVIGHHNNAAPGTTEPGGGTYNVTTGSFAGRNVGKWVELSGIASITNAINAGTLKGIIVGPGVTTGPSYYGYAGGSGAAHLPAFRAQYYK